TEAEGGAGALQGLLGACVIGHQEIRVGVRRHFLVATALEVRAHGLVHPAVEDLAVEDGVAHRCRGRRSPSEAVIAAELGLGILVHIDAGGAGTEQQRSGQDGQQESWEKAFGIKGHDSGPRRVDLSLAWRVWAAFRRYASYTNNILRLPGAY